MATKTTTKKTAAPKAKKATPAASGEFAVIATGGKQYIVRVGDVVTIEKMDGEFTPGKDFVFDQVLMSTNGTTTKVGTPTVSGAKVTAQFIENGRAKKIDVVKYQAKSRYYKKRGHRQPFMKFKITAIA